MRIGESESAQKGNISKNFLYLGIGLFVLYILGWAYSGRYYGDWSPIPFKGVYYMIKNYQIWGMSGVEVVQNGAEVVNQTINQSVTTLLK